VTDNNGITATASVDIPNWVPSSSFTLFPDTFCSNNPTTATYSGDASDSATYSWSVTEGSVSPGFGIGPQNISAVNPGNHDVTLSVTENGCQSLPTQHGFYLYTIGASIDTTATPLCFQSPTGGLSASGNSGILPYHYGWSNGVSSPYNPGIVAGIYTVTVTDAIGCTASATASLTDQTPIVAIVDAFSETCLNACDGHATVSVSGSTPPYTYQWLDNVSVTDAAIGYCTGNYTVTILDANHCSAVSDFTVSLAATLSAVAVASPSFAIAPADIQFQYTGEGATTWFWQFGDGFESSLMNPIHHYEAPGIYTVNLVVTNGPPNYCTDSTAIQVEIVPPSSVTIPNVFTPNSDGVNDGFYAKSEGIDLETMEIFNRWGRLIYTSVNVSEPWTGKDSNGTEVADGVYFYVYTAVGFDKKEYNLHGSVTLLR
jgi:gliding motility-associated-like protein